MLVDMLNIERYKILLEKEIVAIEKEEGSLPKAYREGMRFGYILAATQWHGAGLLEGPAFLRVPSRIVFVAQS